jgi:vacuolar-type H+-ATPase subunit H
MSRKLFVDSEALLELVDQLRVAVPQGIAEADEVIRKREDLLNQSLGEARRIRASAETEFRSRVDDTELLKEAQKDARKICQEAELKAQRILDMAESEAASRRNSADQYAQGQLYSLEEKVAGLLSTVRNGIEVLEAQQKVSR